ncbi:sulfatase-like hydrolase/transferase [Paenibacillus doosanensis]|uniref:sulfatase-like hydrolase/transferase n=1 Tax=Paenibacillus doosanensis TaxID=1229154 RepID=UPI00217FF40B|nr:sulfatase-like hydrolase/transferase [Paenibacillus doosanensis]MCS7462818.1 sulfatase-like hydrolase/transferase [Paenibacillus doosanensis]
MTQPNLLIIMLDQLRYDCIGYSGAYPVRTPNIDRLAAEGLWFENAFTPIPTCCPARQAFISGRRPETFGALWNFKNGLPVAALDPSEYAWPRELGKHAYHRVHLGKWDVHPKRTPLEYGYDEYVGFAPYQEMIARKYQGVKWEAGYAGENSPIPLEDTQTHWLAERACETVSRLTAKERQLPWYIQLNFTEPHLPCRPSEPFASMYDPAQIPPWGGFGDTFAGKPYIQKQQLLSWQVQDYTWDDWAPIAARYYAVISQTDDAVGRVLQALEASGAADDTMIVFTADHGDMCGSHGMMDKHYILYDDVVKVPLIVKYPPLTGQGGEKRGGFVCNMLDLPPTVLELLKLPVPGFFPGRSLLPWLKGEEVPDWRSEAVTTYNGQQFGLYTQRMLRTKRWKYIWNTTDVDELYDLELDPYELTNRIHDPGCRELVKTYRLRLYERLTEEGDGLVGSEWMRNQLVHNAISDGRQD